MIEVQIIKISSISKVIGLLHCSDKRFHHNIDRGPELNSFNNLIVDASNYFESDSWPSFG